MFPLSMVRTFGPGYQPIQCLPQPIIILPAAPPQMDFVQLQPAKKKRK